MYWVDQDNKSELKNDIGDTIATIEREDQTTVSVTTEAARYAEPKEETLVEAKERTESRVGR